MRLAQDVTVPAGVDECRAWLEYEGEARRVMTAMKYRNDRRTLAWLAAGMAGLLVPPPRAVVTWLPTSGDHRRVRGFDQAELLARAVARRWRRECRGLLVRRGVSAQTGRSRVERLADDAVVFGRRSRRWARPVLLVDDVITTGATVAAAAATLRLGGCPWVGVVAAAHTPSENSSDADII